MSYSQSAQLPQNMTFAGPATQIFPCLSKVDQYRDKDMVETIIRELKKVSKLDCCFALASYNASADWLAKP